MFFRKRYEFKKFITDVETKFIHKDLLYEKFLDETIIDERPSSDVKVTLTMLTYIIGIY